MTDAGSDPFENLRRRVLVESRIPALDALSAFLSEGAPVNPVIDAAMRDKPARLYPVAGGHEVLILRERGEYDKDVFTLKKQAWDHEHCSVCRKRIPTMTLCWVTESGSWILLCVSCKAEMDRTLSPLAGAG